jgi:hypothetical protein
LFGELTNGVGGVLINGAFATYLLTAFETGMLIGTLIGTDERGIFIETLLFGVNITLYVEKNIIPRYCNEKIEFGCFFKLNANKE